jgi:hypothetical protein
MLYIAWWSKGQGVMEKPITEEELAQYPEKHESPYAHQMDLGKDDILYHIGPGTEWCNVCMAERNDLNGRIAETGYN